MNKTKAVNTVLHFTEQVGLFIIFIATLFAVYEEVLLLVVQQRVDLKDLLLLFIYLEIIAMIKIYYTEHRLPIRFPIYIAIVALSRYIILDSKSFSQWQLLEIAITIVVLTIAVLVVRYGHVKYPYAKVDKDE
ncbi:MAG: phosphate-starvation-inducible PsiE family protein [Gammaproteobacteria bacterium]|nr:phosphate-starvation-inducible PsiE family protein [Gammaproteobacteria bacterium]